MTAVAWQVHIDQPVLAVIVAGLAAALLAAVHAFLVLRIGANQIVSGIAITFLGTGVSGLLGRTLVGAKVRGIEAVQIPYLSDLPAVGIFFRQDALVYGALLTGCALWVLLYRTRAGLWIRAIGEDPDTAYAQGIPVIWTRAGAVVLGGFLAGVGGAHLAIAYTHVWAEKMTAGQGWIAVGLVIVGGWHPLRSLFVAWLFGAITVLHPQLQAAGIDVSPYLVAMLPYVLSIVALSGTMLSWRRRGFGVPAALGRSLFSDSPAGRGV
jgi:simple sugar transport system permease protein